MQAGRTETSTTTSDDGARRQDELHQGVYDAKGKQIGWAIHCGDDISFVPVPSGYQEYAD